MTLSSWKLLSLLLDYPGEELLAARDELRAAAAELPPGPEAVLIAAFCEAFAEGDGAEWQRRYVRTFDFSRRTGLNLSYYAHGDRRQRGVALLQLKRMIGALELELATDELPDHLPLLLELADVAGDDVGRAVLGEYRPALTVIGAGLRDSDSPYALLLAALDELLGPLSDEDAAGAARLALDGPPNESVGLEPFAPPEVMPIGAPR